MECEKSQKRDEFKIQASTVGTSWMRASRACRTAAKLLLHLSVDPPRKDRCNAISVTKKGPTLTAKTNKNSFGFASGRRKSDTNKCLIIRLLQQVARASGHKKGTAGAVSLPSDLNRLHPFVRSQIRDKAGLRTITPIRLQSEKRRAPAPSRRVDPRHVGGSDWQTAP